MDRAIDQNGPETTNYFPKVDIVATYYAREVDLSTTVVLQVSSVYCESNFMETGQCL